MIPYFRAGEEGFCLKYCPVLVDSTDPAHHYELLFFASNRGIVYVHLRNQFNMGDSLEAPEKLITSEEANYNLNKEINPGMAQMRT